VGASGLRLSGCISVLHYGVSTSGFIVFCKLSGCI